MAFEVSEDRRLLRDTVRGALLAFVTLLAGALTPVSALAQAPSPRSARLEGSFQMTGRVTRAKGVPGEHVGEHVTRTWTFVPECSAGPCTTVSLTRARATGTDTLLLHQRSPGVYAGRGGFFGPLRCGKRTYSMGEKVLFKISVRITAAAVSNGVVVATGVQAHYKSRSRVNLTPCVGFFGHDAAKYTGQLVSS